MASAQTTTVPFVKPAEVPQRPILDTQANQARLQDKFREWQAKELGAFFKQETKSDGENSTFVGLTPLPDCGSNVFDAYVAFIDANNLSDKVFVTEVTCEKNAQAPMYSSIRCLGEHWPVAATIVATETGTIPHPMMVGCITRTTLHTMDGMGRCPKMGWNPHVASLAPELAPVAKGATFNKGNNCKAGFARISFIQPSHNPNGDAVKGVVGAIKAVCVWPIEALEYAQGKPSEADEPTETGNESTSAAAEAAK